MNYFRFTTDQTNIFPMANTSAGGNNVTEWNLRSRESVATPSAVDYLIGPSYTHSLADFSLSYSGTELTISSGVAVVNGHFIQSLTDVMVDIAEAVAAIGTFSVADGLDIGLKAIYSTDTTLAGAIVGEATDDSVAPVGTYLGIAIVVLPHSTASASQRTLNTFNLPTDVPEDSSKVTAHLLLGNIKYRNGSIRSVEDNARKIESIEVSRVGGVGEALGDSYVSNVGLDATKLYVFNGRTLSWCDANDSLMEFDHAPQLAPAKPDLDATKFDVNANNGVSFYILHKPVHGTSTPGQANSDNLYYEPVVLPLPSADYTLNTPGVVTPTYTYKIKALAEKLNNFYHITSGKQRGYIDELTDMTQLPPINPAWNAGDYILVNLDTLAYESLGSASDRAPSTMYVVLPGIVTALSTGTTTQPSGTQLDIIDGTGNQPGSASAAYSLFIPAGATFLGNPTTDYFTYRKVPNDWDGDPSTVIGTWYYPVASADTANRQYSNPIILTGNINLATSTAIGGFFNIPDISEAKDGGYVYLDDQGYLRLVDYEILRSGTLAYQLGEDYVIPSGLTIEEIQNELNEFVNERVAFPNASQIVNAVSNNVDPTVINVTLTLPSDEDTTSNLYIQDIDSRFSGSVYLHILGTAGANTNIYISNCEKLRIDPNIGGTPKIQLSNCCLYYDASVIEYILQNPVTSGTTGISDMKLWYKQYTTDDLNLYLNGMTVSNPAPVIQSDEIETSGAIDNISDIHYKYSLRSLTFSPEGTLIGVGMIVKNSSTWTDMDIVNTPATGIVASSFTLPIRTDLPYPQSSIVDQIKVSGTFVTAYKPENPSNVIITCTSNFTAQTQKVVSGVTTPGDIAFMFDTRAITNYYPSDIGTSVPGWSDGTNAWGTQSWNVFSGGTII